MTNKIIYLLLLLSIIFFNQKIIAQNKADTIFSESFDASKFKNKEWKINSTNTNNSWYIDIINSTPFKNNDNKTTTSALCQWDFYTQNEYLITPIIETENLDSVTVTFYAGFSREWLDYKTDNDTLGATLRLLARSDNQTNWEQADIIWDAKTDTSLAEKWTWRFVEANAKISENIIQFAWQYEGIDGDLIAIDNINVISGYKFTKADIISFTVPNQTKEAEINITNNTVDIEVFINSTNEPLITTFEITDGATIDLENGKAVKFNNGETKLYTITPEDPNAKQQTWKITITERDYLANIISFKIPKIQIGEEIINNTNHNIEVKVKYNSDISAINPLIEISPEAIINRVDGEPINDPVDFNQSIWYKLIPRNDTMALKWKVTVKEEEVNNKNNILNFDIPKQLGDEIIDTINNTIQIEVAYNTSLSNVIPTIAIPPDAQIEPINLEAQTFTSRIPFHYKVTATDGSTVNWGVTITKLDTLADILDFVLVTPLTDQEEDNNPIVINSNKYKAIPVYDVQIDKESHEITIILVKTDLSNISANIIISDGATITPKSGEIYNYIGEPLNFTVQAANGIDKEQWKVIFTNTIFYENFDNEQKDFTFIDLHTQVNKDTINWWLIQSGDTTTPVETWKKEKLISAKFSEFDKFNKYSAICEWDYKNEQNEILITKLVDATDAQSLVLSFYAAYSSAYLDNATLKVKMITNITDASEIIAEEINNWPVIWHCDPSIATDSVIWHGPIIIDINQYKGTKFRLAWQYEGFDGDLVAVDKINISEATNAQKKLKAITSEIMIFPNPVKSQLFINNIRNSTIKIFNIFGQCLYNKTAPTNLLTINTSHFTQGTYIIQIQKDNKIITNKIIINN